MYLVNLMVANRYNIELVVYRVRRRSVINYNTKTIYHLLILLLLYTLLR